MVKITKIFYGNDIFNSLGEVKSLVRLLKKIEILPHMKKEYDKRPTPKPNWREVGIYRTSKGIRVKVTDYANLEGADCGSTTGTGDFLYNKNGWLGKITKKKTKPQKPYTYRDYELEKKAER